MNSAQSSWMSTGYAGLPYGELEQLHGGSVSVLGVPVEGGQGPRIGAAPAPDILRKLSKQLEINLPGKGLDLGNLSVSGDWSARLIELVQQIARRHSKPVVLGGASDVALAVLEAFPDASVVAAMPTVRPELVARQSDTFWLGLNGDQPADVWAEVDRRKQHWRTARQLDERPSGPLQAPDRAILWLDMSVIDLGHAAGTIGLNPGGLKPQTLVDSVQQMTCDWQSIVITGMAPELDTRGVTELVALETINAALRNG